MRKITEFFKSRAGQATLAVIGVLALVISALYLVRLFNPPAENPANNYTGVATNIATEEGIEVEIDTDSFPAEWLSSVGDIVYLNDGTAFFTSQELNQIFILRDGTAEVFAGTGETGWRDGDREQARFTAPTALATDNRGNLYIADRGNHRIRVINIESGATITLAGSGGVEWAPAALVDGTRSNARFNAPNGIAVAPNGNVYVSDTDNHAIRVITGDQVLTVAGQPEAGFGDGPGELARFATPRGLDFLDENTLLIADSGNNRIRSLNINTNQVETFAGNGRLAIADGPKLNASFQYPTDIAVAGNTTLFVADMLNHVIRVIPADERVYTLAGTGVAGYSDGPLTSAQFNNPSIIAESPGGVLLIFDLGNKTIRQLR